MNALRLTQGVPYALFEKHTQVPLEKIKNALAQLKEQGLLTDSADDLQLTTQGQMFLDSVLQQFT